MRNARHLGPSGPRSHASTDVALAPLHVRDRARRHEVAMAMARSFQQAANFRAVFRNEHGRARALPHFFEALLGDAAPFGGVTVATSLDRVVGAAVWYPPGTFRMTASRRRRATVPLLRTFAASPGAIRRLTHLGGTLDAMHPEEPHWYLAAVGVEEAFRGSGVGRMLIQAGTDQADAAGRGCYLETFTQRHVRLYDALGFEVLRELARVVPDGPTFRFMWRVPRS